MCDPLIEDCPVEAVAGPIAKTMSSEHMSTDAQIFTANLNMFAAGLSTVAYLAITQFFKNKISATAAAKTTFAT